MATAERTLPGIHHITAITADAQQNIDFYCGVLGLRLVKLTVNFDDPSSYHLYYGDELGRPGTILTFFAWPGARRWRVGPPQVTTTAFAVPAGTLDFWTARLQTSGVITEPAGQRFGEHYLTFSDPDGMQLEIVASNEILNRPPQPWVAGPVPAHFAIHGFHSATISEEGYENTAKVLAEVMAFEGIGSEQNRFRYRARSAGGPATIIDLLCVPGARSGSMGAGAVHHIAFRTPTDPQQMAWREELVRRGLNVSPVMDRTYFHSIYYREPGGVLFEIATDTPGFTIDQPPSELGTALKLPPWLEAHRPAIEKSLPPVRLPTG